MALGENNNVKGAGEKAAPKIYYLYIYSNDGTTLLSTSKIVDTSEPAPLPASTSYTVDYIYSDNEKGLVKSIASGTFSNVIVDLSDYAGLSATSNASVPDIADEQLISRVNYDGISFVSVSPASNVTLYVVEKQTTNVKTISLSVTNGTVIEFSHELTPDTGYTLPSSVTVTGASSSYSGGVVTLTNLTSTVSEEAEASQGGSGSLTVTYNSNDIIDTTSDGTYTLPCSGKVMSSDIVIDAENVTSLTVTYNNSNIINASNDTHTYTLSCNGKYMNSDIGISVVISSEPPVPVEQPYITFSSPNTFTLAVVDNQKYWDGTLEYSTNTTNWSTWSGTSAISAASDGTKYNLYVRGSGNTYITGDASSTTLGAWRLAGSNISVSGKISKLLDYSTTPTVGSSAFKALFAFSNATTQVDSSIVDASGLILDSMGSQCYAGMFNRHITLVSAPQLPNTILNYKAYNQMFAYCTSLTTISSFTVESVTNGNTASIINDGCCFRMFRNCTSLIDASGIVINSSSSTMGDIACFCGMFLNCSSLTIPPHLYSQYLDTACYYGMFGNCTSLTTVPSLPATALVPECYYYMFSGCTSIKLSTTQTGEYQTPYRIPTSGTGTGASNALQNMFTNTGGTFTGTPTINTTYYTSNTVIPAT